MSRLNENEIHDLLCESEDDEIANDLSSDEDDSVITDINSVYNQSESDLSESDSDENNDNEITENFISKDKKYVWTTPIPNLDNAGRRAAENIMDTKPGPTLYAITRMTSIESSFDLLMPREIVKIIIDMTNLEGVSVYGENWKPVDEISMKAYFGILLLAGVYRSHGEALENLWNDRNGRPIFKATMPLYRFQNITRVIRFDKKNR